ncbi:MULTISPECIES: hypothetical protein [unclassified Streptomyces]|uniref:hypothetical protein n=1 Tax=unclassified Streptomyces TaxID=2593676 RepID=UPI001F5B28E5|nr:hypothetical protein [Streptomyces sp. HSG2]
MFREPPSRPSGSPAPGRALASLRHVLAVAAVPVLAASVAACGGGERDPSAAASPSSSAPAGASGGVVAPARIEVIAGLAGCEATVRVEAEQLREGVCHDPEGDYLITTFPEERYQRAWLAEAAVYDATYLVGPRWVVSAERERLPELRDVLGGTIGKADGDLASGSS